MTKEKWFDGRFDKNNFTNRIMDLNKVEEESDEYWGEPIELPRWKKAYWKIRMWLGIK